MMGPFNAAMFFSLIAEAVLPQTATRGWQKEGIQIRRLGILTIACTAEPKEVQEEDTYLKEQTGFSMLPHCRRDKDGVDTTL